MKTKKHFFRTAGNKELGPGNKAKAHTCNNSCILFLSLCAWKWSESGSSKAKWADYGKCIYLNPNGVSWETTANFGGLVHRPHTFSWALYVTHFEHNGWLMEHRMRKIRNYRIAQVLSVICLPTSGRMCNTLLIASCQPPLPISWDTLRHCLL